MSDEMKTELKLKSLYRWIVTEKLLIRDSYFAIKSGNPDRNKLKSYKLLLEDLESKFYMVKKEMVSENATGKRKIIKINQEIFDQFVNALDILHEKILDPLNKNDLVFLGSEDEDIYEYKERLINQAVEMT
jgi:hypothetical protein